MDQNRCCNKMSNDLIKFQQMLKKWKKKKKKRADSFSKTSSSSSSSSSSNGIPKGYFTVCVGEEKKRFVIPTEYLSHRAFSVLLREAEEEFGFQQEGVLRMPCEVSVFESILKVVEKKSEEGGGYCYCSSCPEFVESTTASYLPPKIIYR